MQPPPDPTLPEEPTIAMQAVRPPPAPPPRPPVLEVEDAHFVEGPPPRYVGGARLPIGNPVGYVFARLFAFGLDIALVAGVVTLLCYALIAINPITGLPTNTQRGFDATLTLGVAVALVYAWVAEAFTGTTIGKLIFGLHVYAPRERIVGLSRAFVRSLLRPLDVLVIGGVLALLPARRRLGDYAAGTVVMRTPLGRFGPLLGLLLAIVVAGIPFVLVGTTRTLAGLFAFAEFVPPFAVHLWKLAVYGLAHIPH
jgi:uncharacterized RDD family membrane protein YckC